MLIAGTPLKLRVGGKHYHDLGLLRVGPDFVHPARHLFRPDGTAPDTLIITFTITKLGALSPEHLRVWPGLRRLPEHETDILRLLDKMLEHKGLLENVQGRAGSAGLL